MKWILATFALFSIVLIGVGWVSPSPSTPSELCSRRGTAVIVDTGDRVLCLCREDAIDAAFNVALGRGGTGKQREGDRKTPLGEYSLGEPRESTRYGLFIPVGYPTVEQSKMGLTGNAIGVHGPHIAFRWLGRLTVWIDWTLGCVALGTRGDINTVAFWIRRHRVSRIVIL